MHTMLVTKHAAELCALLVGDIYGELPSRILAILFARGRATISQLAQHTGLPPRQLRHGLAVLIQQNLLYHHADPLSNSTSYEANPDACYSLIRLGKLASMIGREYGVAEQDVVQSLMFFGHARISDLEHAFGTRILGEDRADSSPSTSKANGTSQSTDARRNCIKSIEQLHSILATLAERDVIELVGPWTFESPEDVYHRIEEDVTKVGPGEKPTRKKADIEEELRRRLQQERDRGASLKHLLHVTPSYPAKKRKLENGNAEKAHVNSDRGRMFDSDVVVRVNQEKCLVDLRNCQLAQFATDTLGETTGQIYHAALRLLTAKVPRCRLDPKVDGEAHEDDRGYDDTVLEVEAGQTVTTLEIMEHLGSSVNVFDGIGKVGRDDINIRSAEKIRGAPLRSKTNPDDSGSEDGVAEDIGPDIYSEEEKPELDGHSDHDEEDEDQDDGDVVVSHTRGKVIHGHQATNGHSGKQKAKVKFDGQPSARDSRLESTRQHLLLLCESPHGFLRHCGTLQRGQWTIDFGRLVAKLQDAEVDTVIGRTFGHQGLRLIRILREKGKLDDKTLPTLAMMKKSDVFEKLMAMQVAGFVGLQEVPKDMTHKVRNTIHLRFFDPEGARARLLDNLYKAMLRCLQTLEVQRHMERNILSFVDRKDVKGKEEEVMGAQHYNRYTKHLDLQRKLLGQVMRMDDVVAVLRDY